MILFQNLYIYKDSFFLKQKQTHSFWILECGHIILEITIQSYMQIYQEKKCDVSQLRKRDDAHILILIFSFKCPKLRVYTNSMN